MTSLPTAIDEHGKEVVGRLTSGYHGTGLYEIDRVILHGLPDDKGDNRDLPSHAAGGHDTAFRGLTTLVVGQRLVFKGACEHACEGGYVFDIRGVIGWNLEIHASRAIKMHTPEGEIAILRGVQVTHIKRYALVEEKKRGNAKFLQANQWTDVS